MQTCFKHQVRVLVGMVIVGGALLPGWAAAEEFQITIENLSPNVLTPAPFISHDAGFDLFSAGAMVSAEMEMLAEDGMPGGVVGLAGGALGGAVADFGVAGAGPIGPGGSATVTIQADAAHPYLSFASMLAFSNDGFIGWALGDGALDLMAGGTPFAGQVMIMPADVWDAGTEVNDELAAHVPALGAPAGAGVDENGVLSSPHAGIQGIGDIPASRDWRGGPVARITIVPEPAGLAMLVLAAVTFRRRGR